MARSKLPTQRLAARSLTLPMREAISRSGYLLEQQLIPVIEKWGYKATPNQRFVDPVTNGVAELDIHAINAFVFSRKLDLFWPVLLVECKNLRCPLVFFTQREIRARMFLGQPHLSGLPCKIANRGRMVDVVEFLQFERFHHYYTRARIASQFCAVYPRKEALRRKAPDPLKAEDYVAGHKVEEMDLYADGILKLVHALVAERRIHAETFRDDRRTKGVHLQVYYPILVTGGSLYECFIGASRPQYRRVHRIGYLHRGSEKQVVMDDRIDIVDAVGFRRLLKTIDDEMSRTGELLVKMRRRLEKATEQNDKRLRRVSVAKRLAVIAREAELIFA